MAYTELTYSDSATTALGTINSNAGEDIVTSEMSASQAIAALNAKYGAGSVALSMSASQFVDAMNTAFENAEHGDEPVADKTKFTILHVTDPHGYSLGLTQANTELTNDSSIDALLFTGDWTRHAIEGRTAITTTETINAMSALKANHGSKMMLVSGNHDVYDNTTTGKTQQGATNVMKDWMADCDVVWGDNGGVASYWYKDYTLSSTSKLRLIGLDQYETTNVGKPSGNWNYQPIYSQTQINWFINRLKELSSNDYLIVLIHEPVYNDTSGADNTVEALAMADDNLWCSSFLTKFNYKGDENSRNLIPKIMKNYLNGTSQSWTHKNLNSGNNTFTVNANFAGNAPCHFLFYIGGHRHCDIAHILPLVDNNGNQTGFGNQFMIHTAAADWTVQQATNDDLLEQYADSSRYNGIGYRKSASDTHGYRLNRITIDFAKQGGEIKIERIGDMHTFVRNGSTYTESGRIRNSIKFNFNYELQL